MGACASKPNTIEGKAPQVQEAPAQQTPKVAPDTTTVVSADQVAAPDQTPEKVVVEEAKEEEPAAAAVPEEVPTTDAEKAEGGTSEPATIGTKEAEVVQEIVVEEEVKPSASPVVLEEESATPAVTEEKPSAANVIVEVVEGNTAEVIKNVAEENEGEEKAATRQS